jgi:hypothetical protein
MSSPEVSTLTQYQKDTLFRHTAPLYVKKICGRVYGSILSDPKNDLYNASTKAELMMDICYRTLDPPSIRKK